MQRKRSFRKQTLLLAAFLCTFLFAARSQVSVNASETSDDSTLVPTEVLQEAQVDTEQMGKIGSITIKLTDGEEGTSKEGVEFSYTRIADIENGEYMLLDDTVDLNLNKIETAEELEQAATTLGDTVVASDGVATTDGTGKAVIENLEAGVYLLKAENTANYETITPTLIAIPTWDESKGDMLYDVTVIPKHTPVPVDETTTPGGSVAPQTNVENRTGVYLLAATILIVLAAISLFVAKKFKKAGK